MTAALRILVVLASSEMVTTKDLQDLAKLGAAAENSNAFTKRLLLSLDSVLVLMPAFAGFDDQQIVKFGDSMVGKTCVDALYNCWHLLYDGVLAQQKLAQDRGGVIDQRYSPIIDEYNRIQDRKICEVVEVSDDDQEEPPSKKPKNALVISDNEEELYDDDATDDATDAATDAATDDEPDDDFGFEAADKRRHDHFISCFSYKQKSIEIQ